MKPLISMRQALSDPRLLAHALPGASWDLWRTMLIAAMGEPLMDAELEAFKQVTGRTASPPSRVEELVAVVGRRGGKDKAASALASYLAAFVDWSPVLSAGEFGFVFCVGADQRQATITRNYIEAVFDGSPMLSKLVSNKTADTIELSNNFNIEVRPASFRRLRGSTAVAVIATEAAFWMSDETSSNPDTEILAATRPMLATTGGPLIIISSPYAKRGELWELHRRHYGPEGDPLILVAQGASRDFNPTLPQHVVDRALERDHAAATAEYLAQFRTDIEGFVSFEIVQQCVGDHVEMAPLEQYDYTAFVDPSGGSSDSFTTAISHKDGERIVIDAIREARPPFSPAAVIDELSSLLKTYRVARVTGDRYAGEFPREGFRKHGIEYRCAEKPKSDLFRDLLPLLNSGRIVLPKSERLVGQLCALERRTTRAGKDSIDHGPNGHDDIANACAGAADLLAHRHDPNAIDLGFPCQEGRGPSNYGAEWGAWGSSPDREPDLTPWLS
jgi:hypothetical protein